MTAPTRTMLPVHPVQSIAWLVLETANSIYSLEVDRSRTKATCHKGRLEDGLFRENVASLPSIVTRTWAVATGMDGVGEGARPTVASEAVQNVLSGTPFVIDCDNAVTTTGIEVARWVLSEDHILNPVRRTRLTANVFADIRPHYGSPVPMTSLTCCACGRLVDITEKGEFSVSRVNGDSRWGYEPMHNACTAPDPFEGWAL